MDELKKLLKEAGITDETIISKLETAFDQAAKDRSKGVEITMQKRFNELTKERDEAKSKLIELSGLEDKYKTDTANLSEQLKSLEEYKTKYEAAQQQTIAQLRERWQRLSDSLKVPETDKRFANVENAKKRLVLKEKQDEYTEQELIKNIETFELFQETGYLDKVDSVGTPNPDKGDTRPPATSGGVVTQAHKELRDRK